MAMAINEHKTNKSERTRSRIVNSYLDLMTKKEWDKITVRELCEKCSITRGTFYNYYNDIYDLMETLETSLLEELVHLYEKVTHRKFSKLPESMFIEKFDYAPPKAFMVWFEFVEKNKKTIIPLLDRKKGDVYFVKRLKQIMITCIGRSMDNDGLPNDELRSHFIKLIVEMHIIAAQSWIEEESEDPLTVMDIVNLLNTMRVGACYLNFKSLTDPEFEEKMSENLSIKHV